MIHSVVVTYNGRNWLDKCIHSLVNSTVSIHVIVVDNGSTDGTQDVLREKYPQVELIETYQNLGFGKANNIGLKKAYEAGADHVFLLNQDAWVEADTVEKLVEAAKRHPEYGIVSPVHLNGDGSAIDYSFFKSLCISSARNYFSDLYLRPGEDLAEIYELEFINAAFWLLSRRTMEIVGGFNPFFFHYGEDDDYVRRCHYFDLKIGFVPFANACHDRAQYDSEGKKKIMPRISFLIDLFDPAGVVTIDAHIKALRRALLKNLLFLQIRQAQYLIAELRYYHPNRKRINEISQRLKSRGVTFLD